jgi:hypothetical protein
MTNSKYGPYISTDLKHIEKMPDYKGDQVIGRGYDKDGYRLELEHINWMDGEVIPGAFYAESTWIWPSTFRDQRPKPILTREELEQAAGVAAHAHEFSEVLTMFGCNPDDPSYLGVTIEFWMENEKFILDKSFMVYIPAGMVHCPLKTLSAIESPIFHYTVGPGQAYS